MWWRMSWHSTVVKLHECHIHSFPTEIDTLKLCMMCLFNGSFTLLCVLFFQNHSNITVVLLECGVHGNWLVLRFCTWHKRANDRIMRIIFSRYYCSAYIYFATLSFSESNSDSDFNTSTVNNLKIVKHCPFKMLTTK